MNDADTEAPPRSLVTERPAATAATPSTMLSESTRSRWACRTATVTHPIRPSPIAYAATRRRVWRVGSSLATGPVILPD